MQFCRVIVDGAPFVQEEGFTYRVPEFLRTMVQVGSMVYVPFGKKNGVKKGFVIAETLAPEEEHGLKELLMVHRRTPVVTPEMMALCRFVSDSYACAMIYALKLVVPKYMMHHAFVAFEDVESGAMVPLSAKTIHEAADFCTEGRWRIIDHDPLNARETQYFRLGIGEDQQEALMAALKRAPKQKAIVRYVMAQQIVSDQQIKETVEHAQPALKALLQKGILVVAEQAPSAQVEEEKCSAEPMMTAQQQAVFDALLAQLGTGAYHKSLINGVTGSGKTLIYEKIADVVIQNGHQALILVPEIALSQQLYLRLQRHFGTRIALLHSQLSERERFQIWQKTADHEIDVVLGPRSALFLPFADLGLIVIDEEHDGSYKQSEPDPRYHAVRVAEFLARRQQAVLLLGSATPSIDTLYEVVQHQCYIFNLPERVHQAAMPEMRLVDMAEERKTGNYGILSEALRTAMTEALAKNEQIILLINRKGYSSSVVCKECGEVLRCPRCDIPLTYYQSSGALKCNYCEYHIPMVERCPSCGSAFMEKHGTGTESLEQECARLFPQASIDRLDAQALENAVSREKILQRYAAHQTDILVGTQLLAKGLDFDNTTCIGVVNADLTLNLPDFRSAERCFQLMVQVAGRAGRDQKPSTVFIQTYQPEHYAFRDACAQNVHQFFLDEMAFRREWLYPPIVRLCRVIVSDFDVNDVEKSMVSIYNYIVRLPIRKDIMGPSFAPLSKKNNRYRMHLIIKTTAEEDLSALMQQFRRDLRTMHLKYSTRVLIDIDPENIF